MNPDLLFKNLHLEIEKVKEGSGEIILINCQLKHILLINTCF